MKNILGRICRENQNTFNFE